MSRLSIGVSVERTAIAFADGAVDVLSPDVKLSMAFMKSRIANIGESNEDRQSRVVRVRVEVLREET